LRTVFGFYSAAGHYVPAAGQVIVESNSAFSKNLKGIGIGNGWVDPKLQYAAYSQVCGLRGWEGVWEGEGRGKEGGKGRREGGREGGREGREGGREREGKEGRNGGREGGTRGVGMIVCVLSCPLVCCSEQAHQQYHCGSCCCSL
jgi:hypothetical protein